MSSELPKRISGADEVVRVLRPANEPAQSLKPPPPTPRTNSKRRTYILAAAIVCAASVYGATQWWLGPTLPAFVATKDNVLQTLVASGHVETPLRVDIGAQVTGTVAAIPVLEGQSVVSGQTLIVLENSEAKAAVAAARAALIQAETRIKQIRDVTLPAAREALRRAQVNQANSLKQLERVRGLRPQNLASQAQLDDAEVNAELAQSELRSAQLQTATNEAGGSDYLLAQTTLQQSRANLDAALARLKYATIVAPTSGTLIARSVERGDVVQPGKALMVLSPAGQVQLIVQIDEVNLASLRLGQSALASADAYPSQQFSAEVAYINPSIDADRGSVEVKLNVANPPDYLRQDMTVSVDIEVARRDNTLTLAANAVHDVSGPTPWVMKVVDGKAIRQPVKLGARGTGKVEIMGGLQANDRVLSAVGPAVAEGKRVRTESSAAHSTSKK